MKTKRRRKPGNAPAKAKLLTMALRAAAHEGASPQAQALLAILIAESWPEDRLWIARIGWPVLERRLGASRRTLRRWAEELDELDLVQRIPGDGRRLTQWGIFRRNDRGDAPVHSGGCTSATPEDAPVRPVTRLSQDISQRTEVTADA